MANTSVTKFELFRGIPDFTASLRHILVYNIADLSFAKEVRKWVPDCLIMRNTSERELENYDVLVK